MNKAELPRGSILIEMNELDPGGSVLRLTAGRRAQAAALVSWWLKLSIPTLSTRMFGSSTQEMPTLETARGEVDYDFCLPVKSQRNT